MYPKKEIKETEEGTPESRQIVSFEHLKKEIEADITETVDDIHFQRELVDRKHEEIDLLDYLIAKLNERIEERKKEVEL
jgi:peptidoglycan hydrolase CwlO-like protein